MIDHSSHTAIDKSCGFNLLNECTTPIYHKRLIRSPKKKRDDISRFHKLMLAELKLKCTECLKTLTDSGLFEPVKQIDVIAAIKQSIEILASRDHLANLEKSLKAEYIM